MLIRWKPTDTDLTEEKQPSIQTELRDSQTCITVAVVHVVGAKLIQKLLHQFTEIVTKHSSARKDDRH